ncbi:S-adenosyl-L-methionine-dependent methyltransferase [Gigaspora rosea]|uniref:S-adenosyl-L-methionine-dependent methyltransferase n=1 Tax=Gigaspora rosea TaxID=44941 RepID=A0A397VVT0_9GLOM|nr:S-adenosyl-L-methionine-dependent methyltransferase [Gigaspora rosea]
MSKIIEKPESINSKSSQTEFRYVDGRRFHNVKDVVYALPNDEEESDRLHLQHFLLRYIWQSNFSAPIEHILSKSDSKILDAGYPSISVVGLDISPHQPTQIKPSNFTFVKANILEGLPFEDNTFDFVFQRYLVSAYSKDKWPYVINELVRVLKPGGFLELCEFSHLFDTGPANQRLWSTVAKVLEGRGVDLNTCQKLEEYMQNQDKLENIKKEVKQCYHGLKSNDIELSKVAISNTTSVYASLKQPLTKTLNISKDEFDELVKVSKDELFEFDTYYNVVRVYARKINHNND